MTDLLPDHAFTDFPTAFHGPVHRPGQPGYAAARSIWNMRTAHHEPALIAQAADRDDVVTAVRYAYDKGVPIAVRGGGHGIDALAMPDKALVLDTSLLKGISVEPRTRQATIEAGVLLGEMDAATQEHGLVVPAGVVSDTGAVGLTLGGGIGHLTRRLGATVDNVLSIEAVTADGRVVTATATSEPELFWGLRGAGHNLAVATSVTYQAHPVGPQVMSGLMVYSADDGPAVFAGIDAALAESPRELAVSLIALAAPPLPGLPDALVGTPVLVALIVWTGELARYDDAMRSTRELADPLADLVEPASWVRTNSIVDPFEPAGRRQHLLGGYLPAVDADLGRRIFEQVAAAPAVPGGPPSCLITLPVLGGALFDADEDSCAFSRVGAEWLYEVSAHWDSPDDDPAYVGWVAETDALFGPAASASAYVNLSGERDDRWLRGAYGSPAKWERLVELKRTWDPDNRFAYNKNILRAAAQSTDAS